MLKISDFSRIAQVSPRTLRYYDDLGLIKPQVIDPISGYRYYAFEQLARLNRILALKDLGFGLDQISTLLDANITPEEMRDYLLQQEREIEARIRAEAERLRRVRDRLHQIDHEDDPLLIDVILKSAPAQPAIGSRMIIPTQPDLMFFCNHMLAEVYRWLKQNRIAYTSSQLILYRGEEYTETDIDTEVAVLLPSRPEMLPPFPHGAMRLFDLPAAPLLATTAYHGKLQESGKTARDLIRWCGQNRYLPLAGETAFRELHLFQQDEHSRPIPFEGTIEFQLQVEADEFGGNLSFSPA